MNISRLINFEFKRIFSSILLMEGTNLTAEDIMDAPNEYLFEELELIKGAPGVDRGQWDNLYHLLRIVDQCESQGSEIKIEEEFQKIISKNKGIKTFQYLLLHYTTESIITGNFQGKNVWDFYKDTLENKIELVSLDDFFYRTNLLTSILLLDNPPIEFFRVVETAVNNFPQKAILKLVFGQLYEIIGYTEQALDWNLKYLGQVESERIYNQSDDTYEYAGDYTIEDYHVSLSSTCQLFYQNNDFDNALDYSDRCLKEFQKRGEDIYSFQVLFVDPMLTRLRVYMQQGNKMGFIKEFNLLKSKITKEELKDEQFKEIVEFAKGLKM